jgi:hypothetical protein
VSAVVLMGLLLASVLSGAPAVAQTPGDASAPPAAPNPGAPNPGAPNLGAPALGAPALGAKVLGPKVLGYTFEHQPAAEALALVRDMLSPMGTVELQPGGNTLVVRDHGAVLKRIESALASFDHPPRGLRFDIHLVRASNQPGAKQAPEKVVRRLRDHLRWESYELLANAVVGAREGEEVSYAIGSRYGVSFRPGAMFRETLKLNDFRMVQKPPVSARTTNKSRQPAPRELFKTDLNLWRGKQFTLMLPQDKVGGQALAVIITFRPEEAQ